VLRRIRMSSQGRGWVSGLLLLALGLTASCTSGPNQNSAAATPRPAASPVSAPSAPGISPAQPPTIHVAPTGGDPAVYAAAISEIQSYLTMEVQHGPYAAAAAYLAADEQAPVGAATTWPVPDADPQTPVLIAGSVYSYEPSSWTSADQFTLYVTLDLRFRGDAGRTNWREGHNTRFFTFSRLTPQTRWRMYVATGP
jgi:hypothetical protein